MSKFKNVVTNALRRESLTKVRLKVDPIYAQDGKIAKFQGYEGYILAEEKDSANVYITECNMIITVPTDMLDYSADLSKLELFKLAVIKYLKQFKNLKPDDNIADIVCNCSAIDTIETYLLNNGCTSDDLLNIYKGMYNE